MAVDALGGETLWSTREQGSMMLIHVNVSEGCIAHLYRLE
jgi:hypothetical protein